MTTNYNHLLTRVFDKQEKKMLYVGDKFWFKNNEYIFNTCDNECIYSVSAGHLKGSQLLITFANRFVPMQCMGQKDNNNILFYQHDIIKTHDNCLCTVEINENMSSFDFQLIGDENCRFCCTLLATRRAKIIGNKWEHPKILNLKGKE